MQNSIETPRKANEQIEIKAWLAKALIGFLLLLVLQGRPLGLARHGGPPHSLDQCGGCLGLRQAITKSISLSFCVNILKLCFWAWFDGWLFAFSLGSALKGFSFVSVAGPSSSKTRPQKIEGRISRCRLPEVCHSCWNYSLLLHSRYVRLSWSGGFWRS